MHLQNQTIHYLNSDGDLETLTSRAHSVGVFILGTEDRFFHHAEEYDPGYPELDPQQILPVARCPDEPQQGVEDVHYAHHHVELRAGGGLRL